MEKGMPKLSAEFINERYHATTAKKLTDALNWAKNKYHHSVISSPEKLEKRIPANITDKNVQLKLLEFLRGSGGTGPHSFKRLTLAALFYFDPNDEEVSKQLLEYDLLNCKNHDGETITHKLARYSVECYEELHLLLSYKPNLLLLNNNQETAFKCLLDNTALHIDIIMAFISGGADINIQNKNGQTVVHIFANNILICFWEFEELMSQNGIDLQIKNNKQKTAFQVFLENIDADKCPLWGYSASLFIEKGADINTQTHEGLTYLHLLAAEKDNCEDKLRELVEKKKANIFRRDCSGRTPLTYAEAMNGHRKNIACLKKLQRKLVAENNKQEQISPFLSHFIFGKKSMMNIQEDSKNHNANEGNYLIKEASL